MDPDEQDSRCTKSFLEHLEDLRHTILWSMMVLVAGMVIAIPLSPLILSWLKLPLEKTGRDPETYLQIIDVTGGLAVAMTVTFWSGLLISIPIVVVIIAKFVFPGLTRREKRALVYASGFAVILFIAGTSMAYFVTLKVALQLMFRINEWYGVESNLMVLSNYVAFVLRLLVAFGLAFELPVLVIALGSMGLVSSDQLSSNRRYVMIGLMIMAMFLTPPDPFTLVLMALPLVLLYELCIWIIRFKEARART